MVIAFAVLSQVVMADSARTQVPRADRILRSATAVFADQAPVIDGRLDDPAWRQAQPEGAFRRDDPSDGKAPAHQTEIRLVYDREALYIGARMYDDRPDLVSRRLSRRDSYDTVNDLLAVMIDSYHDHRTQFIFGVTPAGERRDAVAANDNWSGYDAGWDPVWEAKTLVDSLGWVAELRIPFSQLRFSSAEDQVWGIQFRRDDIRVGEASEWDWSPPTEPGLVSKYGHLLGIRGIPAPRRLEFLPYVSSQARLTEGVAPGNPFDDGRVGSTAGGLDLKYGLTSNLTLTATVNPDFGQVEADPSVVNLTAFETFFEERRPFFVEGSSILGLGQGDGRTRYFYSRRVGRAPGQSAQGSAAFVDEPASTSILGAAKLSGRTRSGWSIGILEALTGREFARVADVGGRATRRVAVEPLSNYGVVRIKRDLGNGSSGFGFMGTAVNRAADETSFPNLRRSAVFGAVDFFHRWSQNTYQVEGEFGASSIGGPAAAMAVAQRSSARYFQRPDQRYVNFDPARTTLRGWTGRVSIQRPKGSWTYGLSADAVSPGFEVNDAGFQLDADRIRLATFAKRNWLSPGRLGRAASLGVVVNQPLNFGGARLAPDVTWSASLSRRDFSVIQASFGRRFEGFDDRASRGGPLMEIPGAWKATVQYRSDGRRVLAAAGGGGYGGGPDGWAANAFAGVSVRSRSRLTFSATPTLAASHSNHFYLASYPDPTATATFQRRYAFAPLRQRAVSIASRLNYYVTPALSLQLYVEPFVASGEYGVPGALAVPREYRFDGYGQGGSTYTRDATTLALGIDADGAGPSPATTIHNPDFLVRSVRSNVVLRWEYRPGSTVFVVWNQSRYGFEDEAPFHLGQNLGRIISDTMQNVLLVKANYYFSF